MWRDILTSARKAPLLGCMHHCKPVAGNRQRPQRVEGRQQALHMTISHAHAHLSNSAKVRAVGLWIVAHSVMPVDVRPCAGTTASARGLAMSQG